MSGVYLQNQKTVNSTQGLPGWKFNLGNTGTIPTTDGTAAHEFTFSGYILLDPGAEVSLKFSNGTFDTEVTSSNATVAVEEGKFILYVEKGWHAGASAETDFIKLDEI